MPPQTPRIRRASWISFCIIVTRFAWIAHRFVSSKRCTRNASAASWSAMMACDCHLMPSSRGRNVRAISRTRREKGSFRIRRSVLFWSFLISRSANVPGRYLLLRPAGTGSPAAIGCQSGILNHTWLVFMNLRRAPEGLPRPPPPVAAEERLLALSIMYAIALRQALGD